MDKHERIEAAYRCFCDYMDGEGLKYEATAKEGEDKRFVLGFTGGEYSLGAVFVFEEDAERIFVGSVLPVTVGKEAREDMLISMMCVNQLVAVGSFFVDRAWQICFASNEIIAGVERFEREYAERVVTTVFSVLKRFVPKFAAVARGERAGRDVMCRADGEDA